MLESDGNTKRRYYSKYKLSRKDRAQLHRKSTDRHVSLRQGQIVFVGALAAGEQHGSEG